MASVSTSAAGASSSPMHPSIPIITSDFRFRSARKLVEGGRVQNGAVDMFRVLYHRSLEEFGNDNLNTALVSYELGFSSYLLIAQNGEDDNSADGGTAPSTSTSTNRESGEDAIEQALEYMAKSCRILFLFRQAVMNNGNDNVSKTSHKEGTKPGACSYSEWEWVQDQIPRVLIGIGDVLSYQRQHSRAVESYLNAVPYREEALKRANKNGEGGDELTTEEKLKSLKHHRLWVEVHVLIAEELLRCPKGQDVLHQYTRGSSDDGVDGEGEHAPSANNVIVKAQDRINLAKSYYEQAKEQLQEIVYKMASMEQEAPSSMPNAEKQSICHLATMLMEVGMTLAQSSEEEEQGSEMEQRYPKKAKK